MFDALLAPLARELIYPRRGTRVAIDDSMHELDVGGTLLRGWVVNPGRDRALVYFGGNGERLELSREAVAHHFPDHTTYLMAYRGYGASEGQPSQGALSADAVALVDHVNERHGGCYQRHNYSGQGWVAQLNGEHNAPSHMSSHERLMNWGYGCLRLMPPRERVMRADIC